MKTITEVWSGESSRTIATFDLEHETSIRGIELELRSVAGEAGAVIMAAGWDDVVERRWRTLAGAVAGRLEEDSCSLALPVPDLEIIRVGVDSAGSGPFYVTVIVREETDK